MPQQQQQQQYADYDLLAVFSDETKAEAAEAKLHKEGFGDEEVFRLAAEMVRGGEFREHGPNRDRSSVFLQTTRSGPNPVMIVLLAIIFGLVLGVLLFAAHFAIASIPEPIAAIAGAIVGIILGAVIGFLQGRRVRGAIGQDMTRVNTASKKPTQGDLNVVAIRLLDSANITRKTRARGILLTNGLGFSPDESTLYHVDSAARTIYAYDYSRANGALRNRRAVVRVPVEEGVPDGLTVDAEGCIWCAHWFGGSIIRYRPDGSLERQISVPAPQTSCLAFGGPDLTDIRCNQVHRPPRAE